ncbi:MAG: hypothetical protein PWQ71_1122, partial [Bacteroidota bacterium]|nr:hypothetical protein [Bacteroidota bacterium]
MRKSASIYLILCFIPIFIQAQNNFRLDTVRVDKNDSRNIHAYKNKGITSDAPEKS